MSVDVLPARPKEGMREQTVLRTIRAVEVPLYSALEGEFAEKISKRGWLVCGPANLALSRILNARTGIPIRRGGQDERFEIVVGGYIGSDNSKMDHTHLRYYTGTGDVYYIDSVSQFLWEKRRDLLGGIRIEKYREDEIDIALQRKYRLYPASEFPQKFQTNPPSNTTEMETWMKIANGPLEALSILGREQDMKMLREKSLHVIRRIEPDWKAETP
jgi:hypothetical protein